MTPKRIMLIAGEASGDLLAAELAGALRKEMAAEYHYESNLQPRHADLAPRFFGAGGTRMAEAGVELAFDMTAHSVIGLSDVLKNYFKFRRLFNELLLMAKEREPHAIICVDFSGFNRRFAAAVKSYVRSRRGVFNNWNPKIIQYVSPQVWASRESRAIQIARDFDLLLSIFPFEKQWYASRVPKLRVEFVGHPLVDRYAGNSAKTSSAASASREISILLLPGSRAGELKRHLPVILGALNMIARHMPQIRPQMVLPSQSLADLARHCAEMPANLEIRVGGLAEALKRADMAIASTGTVTLECAWFGVPTVTLYKTSWSTYQIGKRLVKVKSLTMPNLLAGENIFPEFIQDDATPESIAGAALELLREPSHVENIRAKLSSVIASLGKPGASQRAAKAILGILE